MFFWDDPLVYLFWPNPGNASFTSPKALVLTIVCIGLLGVSLYLKKWRRRQTNPISKRLSRSWSRTAWWFGVIGLFLIICRVNDIQFLAMRFLWVIWGLCALLYIFFQWRVYKARHYEVLPKERVNDPRDKYLPKKK